MSLPSYKCLVVNWGETEVLTSLGARDAAEEAGKAAAEDDYPPYDGQEFLVTVVDEGYQKTCWVVTAEAPVRWTYSVRSAE